MCVAARLWLMSAGICHEHRRELCEELLQGVRGTAGGEGEEHVTVECTLECGAQCRAQRDASAFS